MGRGIVNLARQRHIPDVLELSAKAIQASYDSKSEDIGHFIEVDGEPLPFLNIFPREELQQSEANQLRHPLFLIRGGVWVAENPIKQKKYVDEYMEKIFSGLFPNHNSFDPKPDIYHESEIRKGKESIFPSIRLKMRRGNFNSIVIFNALETGVVQDLSEYPLCQDGEYRLRHLLEETKNNGASCPPMVVSIMDSSISQLRMRQLKKAVGKLQESYPHVNVILPTAPKDETNFEYEFGTIVQFLRYFTIGESDQDSINKAQTKLAKRTENAYEATPTIAAIANSTFLYFQSRDVLQEFNMNGDRETGETAGWYHHFPEIKELTSRSLVGLERDECGELNFYFKHLLFRGMTYLHRILDQNNHFHLKKELFCIAVAMSQEFKNVLKPIESGQLEKLYKEFTEEPIPFPKDLFGKVSESKLFRLFSNVRRGEYRNESSRLATDYLRILDAECRPDLPFSNLDDWLAKLQTIKNKEDRETLFGFVQGYSGYCALILDSDFADKCCKMTHSTHKAHTFDIKQADFDVRSDLWYDDDSPYIMLNHTVSSTLMPLEEISKKWLRNWTDESPPFGFDRPTHWERDTSKWSSSLKKLIQSMKTQEMDE